MEPDSLRLALTHLRAALDLVDDGIILADQGGRAMYLNQAANTACGSPEGGLLGQEAESLLRTATAAGFVSERLSLPPDGLVQWAALLRNPLIRTRERAGAPEQESGHQAVLDVIANLRTGESLAESAARFCATAADIPGFDGVMVLMLPPSGALTHLAHAGRARLPYKTGQRIALREIESLIDLTLRGPWAISTFSSEAFRLFGSYAVPMRIAGVRASAYAPMRVGGKVLGVLSVASMEREGLGILEAQLDTLAELAGVAGTMLANQAAEFGRLEEERNAVHEMLSTRSFRPVFQPIVRLVDGSIHAFEALTRFDDDVAPDIHFASAAQVGLGTDLEMAAANLALAASDALPADARLCLNFSPAVLREVLEAGQLVPHGRDIIVEVTEHAAVEDYAGLVQALESAPEIELSVDDAGAGFASLRHVLELQPRYVKLDIGLVRDVHIDPARAAMVAGMVHFARSTGTLLIAEGVERPEEAQALRTLGVDLAQGYHFGHPLPAENYAV